MFGVKLFFLRLLFPILYMQWVPSPVRPITQPERYIQVSPQARAAYLAQAILWEPQNTAEMMAEQIRRREPTSLQPDQDVSCTYLCKTQEDLAAMFSSVFIQLFALSNLSPSSFSKGIASQPS